MAPTHPRISHLAAHFSIAGIHGSTSNEIPAITVEPLWFRDRSESIHKAADEQLGVITLHPRMNLKIDWR